MEQALIKLGLSEKEAKVYLATLELGEDTVQNIAKKAGVNRATTYVILEKLMGLGLVSSIEHDKKTKFIAESPTELGNILEEEKRQVDSRKHHLDEAMSQLMAVYNTKKGKPVVRYFEGAEGLTTMDSYGIDEVKEISKERLSIFPMDIVEEYFPQKRQSSLQRRLKAKIKSRTIYTHRGGAVSAAKNEAELRDAVYIPREQFPIDATIEINPDWGIKLYNFKDKNFFGVLIQSPSLANNLKELFELAWAQAKAKERAD